MALYVQKYGGTSIGNIEKISSVADKIISEKNKGNDLVVVVSAGRVLFCLCVSSSSSQAGPRFVWRAERLRRLLRESNQIRLSQLYRNTVLRT